MKNVAHPIRSLSSFALLCAALLLAGCSDSVVESTDTEAESPKVTGEALFRGIMMGEGQVANDVPQVRDLYALDQVVTDKTARTAMSEFNDELIGAIKKNHPGYFGEFRKALTSGDQLKVRAELRNANQILMSSLHDIPEVKQAAERISEDPEYAESILSESDLGSMDVEEQKVKDAMYLFAAKAGGSSAERGANSKVTFAVGPVVIVAAAVHMYAAVTHSAAAAVQITVALAYWNYVGGPSTQIKFAAGENAKTLSLAEEQLINSVTTIYAGA